MVLQSIVACLAFEGLTESAVIQTEEKPGCNLNSCKLLSNFLNIEKNSHLGPFLLKCISFALLKILSCAQQEDNIGSLVNGLAGRVPGVRGLHFLLRSFSSFYN